MSFSFSRSAGHRWLAAAKQVRVVLTWLGALTGLAAFATPDACPYVFVNRAGYRVVSAGEGTENERPAAVSDELTIPAAEGRPAFQVKLRPQAETDVEAVPPVDVPIFVMADTHGQFGVATELLIRNGVISPDLHWSFGRGRLVVLGDIFDRGEHHTELFWLLYQLEAEAAKGGGRVHVVLGNHETMVLRRSLEYTNPRYLETATVLRKQSYSDLWGNDTVLGLWLRTKPTMLKIGRILFVHGGISPDLLQYRLPIHVINSSIRAWLYGPQIESGEIQVNGPLGPLWYRGYFPNIPELARAKPEEVQAACAFYDVDRVVVGHTIVPHVITYYDGRVVAVDVDMQRDEKGAPVAEGVIVERGLWYRASIDGTRTSLSIESVH